MLNAIKTLWNDRRGNVLAITGAAIPLIIGSAGLATDTIEWVVWKRELQRAADSAAFAGVMGQSQGRSASDSVTADLDKRINTGAVFLSGYPQVGFPTATGYSNAVSVTLAIQKRLSFSSFLISTPPIIRASGTAALVDDGSYCVVALEPGSDPGISIGGSSNSSLGCGAISDAMSSTSVATNGGSYTFNSTVVAGAGNLPNSINGTSTLQPYHVPLPDPFASKYPTDIPPGNSCKNFNQMSYGSGGSKLKAGCYNSFKLTGNGTYTMDPGVYYLNSTDFDVGGGVTLIGDGVTIILTGNSPGSVKTNGNSGIQLTAQTGGTYDKMLFIQSSAAVQDNQNEINGNSGSKYDGAMYFPTGLISFTGTSGSMTKCAMVVSKKVQFNGNANLQNDVSGCTANKTVPGKTIRLVA